MKFLPANWNDTLSLVIILGVPLLWVFGNLSELVAGATISVWTLVAQHYFRKAASEKH